MYKARKGLVEAATNPDSSDYVKSIATEMLQFFREHFGDSEDGTVATENLVPGRWRHPKGINMLALMSFFLDPRMKGGVGISEADKVAISDNIRNSMIEIAAMEVAGQANQAQHQIDEEQPAPHQPIQPLPADELDMFDEIYHHYSNENENRATSADAELTLYKQEPSIQLKNDDGTFNCPLTWWKFNEKI